MEEYCEPGSFLMRPEEVCAGQVIVSAPRIPSSAIADFISNLTFRANPSTRVGRAASSHSAPFFSIRRRTDFVETVAATSVGMTQFFLLVEDSRLISRLLLLGNVSRPRHFLRAETLPGFQTH
jgi:hypothetical protein